VGKEEEEDKSSRDRNKRGCHSWGSEDRNVGAVDGRTGREVAHTEVGGEVGE